MTEVNVTFCNIQSHLLTSFSLKPGANFILSDSNNAGKTTIFKVLKVVSTAPNVNDKVISRLIRNGTSKAYAAFQYDDTVVIAWFMRGVTEKESSKMFFECKRDGETIRSQSCPVSLLDTLGIVLDKDGTPLNFNDADSVQLIAQTSVKADSILTRVMLDTDVEKLKYIGNELYKDIAADFNRIRAKQQSSADLLSRLSYAISVEEFKEKLPFLEVAAGVADNLQAVGGLRRCAVSDTKQLSVLHRVTNALCECKKINVTPIAAEHLDLITKTANALQLAVTLRDEVSPTRIDLLSVLRSASSSLAIFLKGYQQLSLGSDELSHIQLLLRTANKMNAAYKAVNSIMDCNAKLNSALREKQEIEEALSRVTKIVQCPVKGEVYFSNEQCISRVD